MEYRHLRFFTTLAAELHFTRASRLLNVAQPHLSHEIRRLEEEIGVELLLRTSRHVELTDAGGVFLEYAQRILNLTEEAGRATLRAGQGATGKLTIGFAGSASYDVLPRAIRSFRAQWPDVELRLQELSTYEQIGALRENRIDIGLMRRTPHTEKNLVTRVVQKEPLLIALSSGHRLAKRGTVAWKDLKAEPWIVFDRTPYPGLFGELQSACNAAGFEPVIAQEAGEIPTMINLVAGGLGAALVPQSVTSVRREGVVYRKLRPAPKPSLVVMAWRRDSNSLPMKHFLETAESL